MRDYDENVPMNAEGVEEPDRRVVAMQRLVEAERAASYAERQAERAAKDQAVARDRLEKAHHEVRELLGLVGVSANAAIKKADW